MSTIQGSYDFIDETLLGTSFDDLFLIGEGTEYAIGGLGVDTAVLNTSLQNCLVANYFLSGGIAAIVTPSLSGFGNPSITFLDGIEKIEFADTTIDLTSYPNALLQENNRLELDGWDPGNIISGDYDFIAEDFTGENVLFLPGKGDATLIGSSNYEEVIIPTYTSNAGFDSNGARATHTIEENYSSYSVVSRDVESIYSIDEYLYYDGDDSNWYLEEPYQLDYSNPSGTNTPETEPETIGLPDPEEEQALENYYEIGALVEYENYYYEDTIDANTTTDNIPEYDYTFSVSDVQQLYCYFELYDFTDDLDLVLYEYNAADDIYNEIRNSSNPGTEAEEFFSVLTPGEYLLSAELYEDLDGDLQSSYKIGFDTQSFLEDARIPDDTLFPNQWHLLNTGQSAGLENQDIFAPEAWKIRSTSPEVVVAVIDGAWHWITLILLIIAG